MRVHSVRVGGQACAGEKGRAKGQTEQLACAAQSLEKTTRLRVKRQSAQVRREGTWVGVVYVFVLGCGQGWRRGGKLAAR